MIWFERTDLDHGFDQLRRKHERAHMKPLYLLFSGNHYNALFYKGWETPDVSSLCSWSDVYDERDDSEEEADGPQRRPAPTFDNAMPGSFVSTTDGDVYKVLSRGKSGRLIRMQEWDTDTNEPFVAQLAQGVSREAWEELEIWDWHEPPKPKPRQKRRKRR